MWERDICMSVSTHTVCYIGTVVVPRESDSRSVISENVWMCLSSLHGWDKLKVSRLLGEIERRIAPTERLVQKWIWHIGTGEIICLQPQWSAACAVYHQCYCLIFHTSVCANILHTLKCCYQHLVNSDMILVAVCARVVCFLVPTMITKVPSSAGIKDVFYIWEQIRCVLLYTAAIKCAVSVFATCKPRDCSSRYFHYNFQLTHSFCYLTV